MAKEKKIVETEDIEVIEIVDNEDLENYKKRLTSLKKSLKNYEDQWKIDEELHKIVLENFGVITPEQRYQRIPRYWELQKLKYQYKVREDTHMAETRIAALKGEIKGLKDLIKENKK